MDTMADPFAPLAQAELSSRYAPVAPSGKDVAGSAIMPAPLPLPEAIQHARHGNPSIVWQYLDRDGSLLFAVCRFDKAGGRKEVLPYVCGADGWRWQAPPSPRPLYGLHRLAARPGAPVLLVEGEKAAVAAEVLFPDHVAMTWQGGSNATGKADWSSLAGRAVTVWPDNDAAGIKAAAAVMKATSGLPGASVAVVSVPADWPEGWDVADPLPEGITADMLVAMLAAAEAEAAEDAPSAQPTPASADDVRAVVERAAHLDNAGYAFARADLAKEAGIGLGVLDKLRREETKRRHASARESFDALDDAAAMAAEPTGAEPPPRGGARVRWPPGFAMRKAGLFRESEDGSTRIAGAFAVLGKTRDSGSNGWGLALEWGDDDGTRHREMIPGRLIHSEPGGLETRLHEGGLFVSPDPGDRLALRDALAGIKTTARVRRVTRCGWHTAPGGGAVVYVMPDGSTIGQSAEPVILDGASAELASRCGTAGTLEGWQDEVAAPAVGNAAAAFCIATAFAGPLLEIAGEPSGGFHLAGPSKIGKTTAAQMGVSVWGRPDKRGALRDWRSTANAMESALEEASDGLLALDEIAQADAREVESAIYQAGNEGGKARLRSDATARARRTWRVMMLSTGEVSPAQKAAEAGKGMRPGAEVRLPSLRFAAEAAAMWPVLHGASDRDALWRGIHDGLRHHHGTPARAFLAKLAAAREAGDVELQETIAECRRAFLAAHLPTDAPDQARTVALRFALVAAAGEMAADMGVLPWPVGEATSAAAAGFKAWLSDRGGAASGEDAAAVQAVRTFIEKHGEARFGLIEQDASGHRIIGGDGRAIPNRAGWRIRPQPKNDSWRYLILPEVWRAEVCAGLEPADAARALYRAGYLTLGEGKNLARKERVPSEGAQIRVYVVRGNILA